MINFDTDEQGNGKFDDLTKDQIRLLIGGAKHINQLAEDYFWKRYRVDPEWQREFRYEPSIHVTIEDDTVSIHGEAAACGSGCCGSDTHTYEFPLEHLWLDQTSVLNDIRVQAEKDAREKAEKEAKDIADARKRAEEADRKRLAELMAKYPDATKP
jgi:hypothetical protein